jgi:hypothetical protein
MSKKASKKKSELYTISMVFDNKEAANGFVAYWLDGGGDGGGMLEWDTCYKESSKWDKGDYSKLRIKGTGDPYEESF